MAQTMFYTNETSREVSVSALNFDKIDEIVILEDCVIFHVPSGYVEFDISKRFHLNFYYKGEFVIFYTKTGLEIFAEEQRIVCS
jgi:hypothetical protein